MSSVLTSGSCGADGPVTVLKFGSSLLRDGDGFRIAADEVAREVGKGRPVLVVVSAMRGTTDRLLGAVASLSATPAEALVASLLGTGEAASVALLGIALAERRVHAHVVTSDDLGLRTDGPRTDAAPVAVDVGRLSAWLSSHQAVVVPGFIGRGGDGVPTLLGRGGSDLTALFLGRALGAGEVRLVKDVDGVYPENPTVAERVVEPLAYATWSEVARVGHGVVQEKALSYAERHDIGFRVAAPSGRGTWVGRAPPT